VETGENFTKYLDALRFQIVEVGQALHRTGMFLARAARAKRTS
jgi:hypothetical protein